MENKAGQSSRSWGWKILQPPRPGRDHRPKAPRTQASGPPRGREGRCVRLFSQLPATGFPTKDEYDVCSSTQELLSGLTDLAGAFCGCCETSRPIKRLAPQPRAQRTERGEARECACALARSRRASAHTRSEGLKNNKNRPVGARVNLGRSRPVSARARIVALAHRPSPRGSSARLGFP